MVEWSAKSRGPGQRLPVVFVDDLDAALAKLFQVFEAIKLYLEATGFVFVIGYDPDVINDAILASSGLCRRLPRTAQPSGNRPV